MTLKRVNVPLNGRLITSSDPLLVGVNDEQCNFRQLTNMRYKDANPKGVKGSTKINTTASSTQLQIKNLHHFTKTVPAVESHLLAWIDNGSATGGALFRNSDTIPSATGTLTKNYATYNKTAVGMYSATQTVTIGRFSKAPQGFVVFSNNKQTKIWGGNEAWPTAVIRFDSDDNTKKWDYTDRIANTDSSDTLVMVNATGSQLDPNTLLLLHADNSLVDSSDTGATFYSSGSVAFSSTGPKFGTHNLYFTGSGYYTATNVSAWNFSAATGEWTIDFWYKTTTAQGDNDDYPGTLLYQQSATNVYSRVYITHQGLGNGSSVGIQHETATGMKTINFGYFNGNDPVGTWTHLAIVRKGDSGSNHYLYVNGVYTGAAAATQDFGSYTGSLFIGGATAQDVVKGNITHRDIYAAGGNTSIDEFRISKVQRWTSNFTPPEEPYSNTANVRTELYIGSLVPIQGAKFTVTASNTTACVCAPKYWNGSEWVDVTSFTDQTSIGGVSLAQTGSMAFTNTASVAKPKVIDRMLLYWYRFNFPNVDTGTTLSQITLDTPFQNMVDLWDGDLRMPLSCLEWSSTGQTYIDHTIGIFEDHYDSADDGTRAAIGKSPTVPDGPPVWSATADYLLVGSANRLQGLSFNLVAGKENTVTASPSISYWDGDEWVGVGTVDDGTLKGNKTLAKSGFMTWNPPTFGTEFKRMDLSTRRKAPKAKAITSTARSRPAWNGDGEAPAWIDGSDDWIPTQKKSTPLQESIEKQPYQLAQYGYPIYFYKMEFNGAIAASATSIQIYNIGCVPAQNDLSKYRFPVYYDSSVWLCNKSQQHPNQMVKAAMGTPNVFNGMGSVELRVDDEGELIGAAPITFSMLNGERESLVVFKRYKTYMVHKTQDGGYSYQLVDEQRGCVAPLTIQTMELLTEKGSQQVVIFQGANGIHLCDGRNVTDIHDDIRNVFEDGTIDSTRIDDSTSYYDPKMNEYHWIWSTTTGAHDKEYVFDLKRFKWFEIDRGTGARLQCGTTVTDTTGNTYCYGGLNTGYVVRAENGTTFASSTGTNVIARTMWLGDFVPEGIGNENRLAHLNLIGTATSGNVAITQYTDTSTTANTGGATAFSQTNSGSRLFDIRRSLKSRPGWAHSLKFTATSASSGFEPLGLSLTFEHTQDKRGR